MASNDNLTIDDKVHAYALERGQHYKAANGMDHLPDLGLQLSPAFEARMRKLARDNGVDFDRFAAQYAASRQIIPRRDGHKLSVALIDKGVMPVNHLEDCFAGSLYLQIEIEQARREGWTAFKPER